MKTAEKIYRNAHGRGVEPHGDVKPTVTIKEDPKGKKPDDCAC